MKILIIEDERKLSDSIVSYLSSEKYLCEQAFTFTEARMRVNVYDYDRVVSKSAMAEHLSGDMADVREFNRLNEALGRLMTNSLASYHAQKEFTENASHELQTPWPSSRPSSTCCSSSPNSPASRPISSRTCTT